MEKLIWITGGSSGIGYEISKIFAENGSNILVTSRNIDKLKTNFTKFGKNVLIEACDVRDFNQIEAVYSKYKDEYNFEGIINNAGISSFKPFKYNNIDEIYSIINTNLLGAIFTTKVLLPHFTKINSGKIFNILSVAATKIFTNSSIYAASKAGLLAFANVLREEVRKNNISLTNILPGATATPIWSEDNLSKYSDRMMKAEDLAKLIFTLYYTNSSSIPEEITVRPIYGDL